MKYTLLLFSLLLFGCKSNSKAIGFSVLDQENKTIQISKAVNDSILNKYFESTEIKILRKLILSQVNGDKLIVEQKDEKGFLIILTIRHEQFLIKEQLDSKAEVLEIMKKYLVLNESIMDEYQFY